MADTPEKSPEPVQLMQEELEQCIEDLILDCFTDEFPEDAENAKFVLSSIYHVCGHLAAKNGISAPDLIGLMAYESLEAQICVTKAMNKVIQHFVANPGALVTDPGPKDVN
jgi:hypothetical protein